MLNSLSFSRFTTTFSNLWNTAKNYVNLKSLNITSTSDEIRQVEQERFSKKQRTYQSTNFKRLLVLTTLSLVNTIKNQPALSLGLVTLFAESVDAAYPTVANPIPTQYIQPDQAWNYDIDLNHVFNDADGDIMTFAGVTMSDGSLLPSWLTASPIKLSGRDYANQAFAVEVVGDLAYVANGQYGLLVFNVSKPNQKVFVSSFDTQGQAYDVAVQDGVAYVADYSSGLQLINVSNPTVPSLLGNYDTPGTAYGVAVQDGVAYVADYSSGLQLINVSNPTVPSLLGNYDTPGNAYDIAVQAGIAYVADDTSGLQLINVNNPAVPSLLGNYDTPGYARGVAVQAGIAYVADAGSGLQLINVNNPAVPSLLGNYDTPGYARGVAVQAGIAYVADDTSGLQIIGLGITRLNAMVSFNATGNYSLKVHATNVNGEWISTDVLLRITNMTQPSAIPTSVLTSVPSTVSASTSLTTSILSTTTNTQTNPSAGVTSSSSVISDTDSLSTGTSTTRSQSSASTTFSIITSSIPLGIEADSSTILTTEYLSVSGNVNSDQVTYIVLGNNPDIVITINGVEVTQFTQADVEGQLIEIALSGVTCGDYSTDLQLEANVAGSNAPAQQVNVALIFEGTTCSNAERLSVFSFRDTGIGFWSQKREVEQRSRPVQSHNQIPTFRY